MSITVVPRDIIQTHIIPKLDGHTLVSAAATSPLLRLLCTEENLWKDICTATWHSINDSHVHRMISTFPSGYRSFFSNSSTTPTSFHGQHTSPHHDSPTQTSELISAVDICYKNKFIFSKIEVTDTVADDFWAPPLCIEILRRKEMLTASVQENSKSDNDDFLLDLEKSMSMSWILIDPTQKRSVNLSSKTPVSVHRNSITNEVELLYITILPGYNRVGSTDPVQCRILVACREDVIGFIVQMMLYHHQQHRRQVPLNCKST